MQSDPVPWCCRALTPSGAERMKGWDDQILPFAARACDQGASWGQHPWTRGMQLANSTAPGYNVSTEHALPCASRLDRQASAGCPGCVR
jgi:hypothetical protein